MVLSLVFNTKDDDYKVKRKRKRVRDNQRLVIPTHTIPNPQAQTTEKNNQVKQT
jgi:hypothetical protein